MKAKLIRDMDRLIKKTVGGKTVLEVEKNGLKAGTELDDPKVYLLVRQGCAVPADDECARRAGINPETFEKAKFHYEGLEKGIDHEKDWAAYERGLMVGYKPNGKDGDTWIPGPNWYEGCEAEYYEPQDDEENDE